MRFLACLSLALAVGAGCGKVKDDGQLADAPLIDSMPDAPTIGTVKVTVLDSGGTGAPAVGAKVVFINPDGTVVKDTTTDGAGKAEAEVMTGASVTSAQLNIDAYIMQTTLAVKPGDDLILGSKNSNDFSNPTTLTVSWTAFGGTVGQYVVVGPCGTSFAAATATSTTLTFYPYCTQAQNEIIVLATNNTTFDVIVSVRKTGVALSAGSVVMPNAWEGARTLTASYSNINPTVTSLALSRIVPDGFGYSTGVSMASPGPTVSLATTGATGSAARIVSTFRNTNGSRQTILQSIGGGAQTYGLDVGATLLPWLSVPTFDGAHTIVVPTDTTGTTTAKPDFFRLLVNYSRTDPATNTSTRFNWVIYGPEIADIALPPLPGTLLPKTGDTINISDLAYDVQEVNGWDGMRPDPAGLFSKYAGPSYAASQTRQTQSPLLRGFQ